MAKDYYDYLCKTVPPVCTRFFPDRIYSLLVDEPPPEVYVWPDGPCAGTEFQIEEDDE